MNLEGILILNDNINTSKEIRDFFMEFSPEITKKSQFEFTDNAYYGIVDERLRCYDTFVHKHLIDKCVISTVSELREKIKNESGAVAEMRQFSTGATRNIDVDKLDFEGFLSPLALEEFAKYMHKNRKQANGELRDSDNWQKGIPVDAYMKSMWRHFFDVWKNHRGLSTPEDQMSNLCGLMFNVQGMLHELIKQKETNE